MSVEERMRQFVERMHTNGVAQPGELRGCSTAEIAALERHYGVTLPRSYALFLSRMGHAAGRLGNLGEFDLVYCDALSFTERTRDSASAFPRHGLVFCARLGNPDYWLVICEGQDDSPVIHFDYDSEPTRFEQTHESLLGFLEELCEDAEHWMRRRML
jgi:hypothetical protein